MKRAFKILAWTVGIIAAVVLIAILTSHNSSPDSSEDAVTKIKAQLLSDPDLRRLNIEVTENNSEITISGNVPDYGARLKVYRIAVNAAGEKKLDDQMDVSKHDDKSNSVAQTPEQSTSPQMPPEPPSLETPIHAYDLLKNPFRDQHQIVTLDLNSRPIFYHEQLLGYSQWNDPRSPIDPRIAERLGRSLQLDRMYSEEIALYDVLGGISTSAILVAPQLLEPIIGQLAVVVIPGTEELKVRRDWDVEPRGTLQGTNGFGAPISLPVVKFWRYRDERPGLPTSAQGSPAHSAPSPASADTQ